MFNLFYKFTFREANSVLFLQRGSSFIDPENWADTGLQKQNKKHLQNCKEKRHTKTTSSSKHAMWGLNSQLWD